MIRTCLSMIKMLIIKCNRGFTLAELMVAAGLVGIVSFVVLHLITDMTKRKEDFENQVDQWGVKVAIERALADPDLCLNALQGENGKEIRLDHIYSEGIPDQAQKELERKYIITSIKPYNERLLEKGMSFSGITVGAMSLDKILSGSNPVQKRFRLNLNVPLLDSKGQEIKQLNWPIEVKINTDKDNLVTKCQLHFLARPHIDNSRSRCENWGFDSRGMDTGICARGTQQGFAMTKISPSGDREFGIGGIWRRMDYAKEFKVDGCTSLSPLQDPKFFITGLCWGAQGLWLLKSLGISEENEEKIVENTFVSHPLEDRFILGCLPVTAQLDGLNAQSGICWGQGLYLVKTGVAKEGIERDWNVAPHLPDVMFTSCIEQAIQHSPFKNRNEVNILCSGPSGIAYVKITPIDSMEQDKGIGLDWHVSFHD